MVAPSMSLEQAVAELRPYLSDSFLKDWRRITRVLGFRQVGRAITALRPASVAPPKAIVASPAKSKAAKAPKAETPTPDSPPIDIEGCGMVVRAIRENILNAVNAVYSVVPRRSTLPICKCIAITTGGGRLRLTATDLEVAHQAWCGCVADVDGSVAVPARELRDAIKSFRKDGPVLALTLKGKTLTISDDRQQSQIICQDYEDFPPVPDVKPDSFEFDVDPKRLADAIRETVFAASGDASRIVLSGIDCQIRGSEMTLAAADGFQLAIHKLPISSDGRDWEGIIPARTLAVVRKMLQWQEDRIVVNINATNTQIQFETHQQRERITSMLIQGTFPNYAQLIQSDPNYTVAVYRQPLLDAVKGAVVTARDGSGILRLEAADGMLHLSARAEEVADFNMDVECEITGFHTELPCRIAVNASYIAGLLAAIPDTVVVIGIKSPTHPITIRPVSRDFTEYTYVVMPMFVKGE